MSVSEVTARIESALEAGLPASLLIQGEVSNYRGQHPSGHIYFTLKDARSCIDCVLFRSDAARVKFMPVDGMELIASGRVGVYGQRGKYQLYLNTLRPVGQGALELAFQQLRAKLEAEGLFSTARKRMLPRFPRRLVLITSRQGAALADMLKVLSRFPWLRILLYSVPVQGEGAGAKVAAALRHCNSEIDSVGGADVILLARGGGSLEDLWAFNEEAVARAVAASVIPIVTGIGHEVDTSIADLVADYHAHTPTEAAQVVTAHWRGASELVEMSGVRLRRALRAMLQEVKGRLTAVERHAIFRRPLDRVNRLRQYLDDRQRALSLVIGQQLRDGHRRCADDAARLERRLPAAFAALRERINHDARRLDHRFAQKLQGERQGLANLATRLQDSHPRHRISLHAARLKALADRLERAVAGVQTSKASRLEALSRQLEAVGPERVLQRGYTITTRKREGTVVRSALDLKTGDRLETRFADGKVASVVTDFTQLRLFD